MSEAWRPIPGYDLYEVSDQGRVRSYYKGAPKILRQPPCTKGYPRVSLFQDGRKKEFMVHQLVCWVFNGDPPDDGRSYDVHHKRDRSNVPDNLEWQVHAEHWRVNRKPQRRRAA